MTRLHIPGVLRRWRFAIALVGVAALTGGGAVLAAPSDPATGMVFHTVTATRVLDTRVGTGAPIAPLGPGDTLDVAVSGLPDDAAAIVVNVTADRGTASSFLTLYPSADPRPDTSTINWTSPSPVANGATVSIHADHSLRVFNAAGNVDVIIDLVGYYALGGAIPGPPGPAGTLPSSFTVTANGTTSTCFDLDGPPYNFVCTTP